jgi:hypothetical protein
VRRLKLNRTRLALDCSLFQAPSSKAHAGRAGQSGVSQLALFD